MEWDFADQSKRRFVADDLVASIRTGAYPIFFTFEAGAEETARLVSRNWSSPEGLLSYLLSSGHTDVAGESLRAFLSRQAELRSDFELFYREFAQRGVPDYRTGGAHDLAALQ